MATSQRAPVRVAQVVLVPVVRGRAALAPQVAAIRAAANAARAAVALPIVAHDAKVDSSSAVRAARVALAARGKASARLAPTDIRAMHPASHPITPIPAASIRTATSRARRVLRAPAPDPAVALAHRAQVAHRGRAVHGRAVRVVVDVRVADAAHRAAIADRTMH